MEITLETLHGDMQGLKGDVQNLKGDVRNLDGRVQNLEEGMHGLRDAVSEMKTSTTRWMVGLFIGGIVLLATIIGVYTSAVMLTMGGSG